MALMISCWVLSYTWSGVVVAMTPFTSTDFSPGDLVGGFGVSDRFQQRKELLVSGSLYSACAIQFRQAQERSYAAAHTAWMISSDGVQLYVVRRSDKSFEITAFMDAGGQKVYEVWLGANDRATLDGFPVGVSVKMPRRLRDAIASAIAVPSPPSIHGIKNDGRIIALYHAWLTDTGTLAGTLFVLVGYSAVPDILSVGRDGGFINPAKFRRIAEQGSVVACDQRIGRSHKPVLWTKGAQNGHGNAIIVQDEWHGLGAGKIGVYEYWRARGGVNLAQALRTGYDIRKSYT